MQVRKLDRKSEEHSTSIRVVRELRLTDYNNREFTIEDMGDKFI